MKPLVQQSYEYGFSDIDSLDHNKNVDFEENYPYEEGIIGEIYQRPDKSYFQELPNLNIKLIQMYW